MTFLSKTYYSKAISEKFDKFDYVIKYLLHTKLSILHKKIPETKSKGKLEKTLEKHCKHIGQSGH